MSEEIKIKGWVRILLIIIPYIFIVGILQFIAISLAGSDFIDLNIPQPITQKLLTLVFSFLGTLIIVAVFVKYVDKEKFSEIGFRVKNKVNEFWIGFFLGLLIMFGAFGILELLDQIQYQAFEFDLSQLIATILIFILVSFTEEILFRGYILRNLMYSFNKYFALILSASIFSFLHGFNPNIDIIGFANIFLAGILLGITYIHTKSLWFPMALHFSWNFFQAILGFKVSGQNSYSMIRFSMTEPTLLNGGAFGFEGSILALITMIVSIIAIILYYRRKKPAVTLVNHKKPRTF
ncbi:CPBP family intramembrane glutamic endopeptidase [Salinimicrobium gaetbulicola]|uniref:CPBP family intramembrane glutamic endopeptidase n=1 Tax=Salinimicrobium gaetbulicola TaxID=999702 RepID=A0ABW3IG70_9FLAO